MENLEIASYILLMFENIVLLNFPQGSKQIEKHSFILPLTFFRLITSNFEQNIQICNLKVKKKK